MDQPGAFALSYLQGLVGGPHLRTQLVELRLNLGLRIECPREVTLHPLCEAAATCVLTDLVERLSVDQAGADPLRDGWHTLTLLFQVVFDRLSVNKCLLFFINL